MEPLPPVEPYDGNECIAPPSEHEEDKEMNRDSSLEPKEQPDYRPYIGFRSWHIQFSQTAHKPPKPLCHPRGTRDDLFTFRDLGNMEDKENTCHLEGIHPDKFEGNRSKTTQFLNQFNRYMLMN